MNSPVLQCDYFIRPVQYVSDNVQVNIQRLVRTAKTGEPLIELMQLMLETLATAPR